MTKQPFVWRTWKTEPGKDITEFERAKNYATALPMHYDGKQTKMAERLNISKGLLSKMIAFANVSDKIMVAFAVPGELSSRQGYSLAQAVSAPAAEARASRAAGAIVKENAAHVDAGKGALPTPSVLARLLAAANGETAAKADPRQVLYQGKPVVTVLDENRNGRAAPGSFWNRRRPGGYPSEPARSAARIKLRSDQVIKGNGTLLAVQRPCREAQAGDLS